MIFDPGPPPRKAAGESWLIIFADLLSLLLTFFVLMFSMSSVQISQWQAAVKSLSENLNRSPAHIEQKNWHNADTALVAQTEALSLPYLKKIFEEKLQYDPILRLSKIRLHGGRLSITLPTDLLFKKGQAEFSAGSYRSMQELGDALQPIKNKITVVGYTDPTPTSGKTYPTNWELSLVRALSVARLIKQAGYSHTIA
ncbi:MAG: OmpA family protein, partial [Alphaproteobacteria bacterium]|nr:OmpA family protein [Alphaproteobacteria bacterium]